MRKQTGRKRQTRYHMEHLTALATDVARAEGRLRAALGMGAEEFQTFAYGGRALSDADRLDRLRQLALQYGVWIW